MAALADALLDMAADYEKAARALPDVLDEAMADLADDLQARVEYHAPVDEDTPASERDGAHLEDSIVVRRVERGEYRIVADKEYAIIVQEGRDAVESDGETPLRFWIDGQIVFRHRVGPADPNPFMTRAVNDIRPDIEAALRDVVDRIRREYLSNTYRAR